LAKANIGKSQYGQKPTLAKANMGKIQYWQKPIWEKANMGKSQQAEHTDLQGTEV
jgi:hypothetical protein